MVILRASCFLALGTTTVRTPFFMEAVTPSWSTRTGKVKERENSPTERSETQYLVSGCLRAGAEAGATLVTSVDDDAFSSSTVALCALAEPSIASGAAAPSAPLGALPEV